LGIYIDFNSRNIPYLIGGRILLVPEFHVEVVASVEHPELGTLLVTLGDDLQFHSGRYSGQQPEWHLRGDAGQAAEPAATQTVEQEVQSGQVLHQPAHQLVVAAAPAAHLFLAQRGVALAGHVLFGRHDHELGHDIVPNCLPHHRVRHHSRGGVQGD